MNLISAFTRMAASALALCLLTVGCQAPPVTPPNGETEPVTEAVSGGSHTLTLPNADSESMPAAPDTDTNIDTDTDGEDTAGEAPFYVDPADSTLPCISIEIDGGKTVTSTTRYLDATLTVSGSEYAHYNITTEIQIRGRGHSSFDGKAPLTDYASKNSYRLKLKEKANLLGVGETADKDWVLVSGKYDISALRNFLVWNLAEQMGTIPYVPSCTWVNLYVNGDFRGMYTLVEKIEVASDRVNIDESPSTDPSTVGYLVEYDLRGAYQAGAKQGLTYFYIPGLDETFAWAIQSEVYTTAVTAAIREHLILCNEAILSGDRARMETYVDMDSFVDVFILQELSKNPDAGCSSFYMQRDSGGKLHLTAPWDFDFAMGTYSVSNTTSGLVADGEGVSSHPWFEFLVTQPWFMELVLKRMEEIRPLLTQTLELIEGTMMPYLREAADANHARWNIYGQKFSIYPSDQVSVHRTSYEDHVNFLVSWVETRWDKMYHAVQDRC